MAATDKRGQTSIRLSARGEEVLRAIGEEIATERGTVGQPPLYRSGEVNLSELIRHLLAKADPRLFGVL